MDNILTRGFWGDEAWTVLISKLPWLDLAKTTAADFHPPLYYTIIHFWMQIFGSGEVAVRMVSIIFWLLAGLAAYLFARKWLAAALVLFNPFVFAFAFEARNYTLFVFLSLASMWLFYKKSSWYLLPTILGLYTHYYMFFLVIAQYLFVFLFQREQLKKWLLWGVVLALLYIPWLPFFLSQAKSVAGGYWIGTVHWDTIVGAILVLVTGEQKMILTYLLPIVFIAFFVTAWRRTKENWLFFFWLAIPFGLPLVISLFRPIFFYRYLIFLSVPMMLWPLFMTKKVFWPTVLLIIYLLVDGVAFFGNTDRHFKPILKTVHDQAKSGDVIYTVLPSFAEVVYYNNYDGRPLPVKVVPIGLAQASGKALLDTYVAKGYLTLENPPAYGRYWYLEPGPKYELVQKN
ncbi:glycosyltransferase family 39 protein [Candidatus Microgenomates bacterium]|nr:glycosyltransferase family 39 protein [Candidatus Microgenomates bacterium]